jgi:hypothetical protein
VSVALIVTGVLGVCTINELSFVNTKRIQGDGALSSVSNILRRLALQASQQPFQGAHKFPLKQWSSANALA